MRRLLVLLVLTLFFAGCAPKTQTCPPALDDATAVYEGEGFTLTYPAVFTLTRATGEAWYFIAEGHTMAFSLTREENTYGTLPIEEYPDAMSIYDGVTLIDDTAFAVEKHIDDMLSGYFLYTVGEEHIYLLEYNYGGTAEEKALAPLFAVDIG